MRSFYSFFLPIFISLVTVMGEEVGISKKFGTSSLGAEEFLSSFGGYVGTREAWGIIDRIHFIEEQTAQVEADRLGNQFLLRTPFGGFLWAYQRTEGEAALFPRRDNVFGGRLHKQPFVSGNQDKREYGYFIDTRRLRKWLEDEKESEDFLSKLDMDAQGHFVFIDSDAAVGDRRFVNFGSENFESIEAELRTFVNKGRWYNLGFDFMYIRHNPVTFGRFTIVDQKETVDRDLWLGRITVPVLENIHISAYYDENHDVHRFKNTNIPSVAGLPTALIPNRSMHPTRRKFGPELEYFFGDDLYRELLVGFYRYEGENAGSLAEYGLNRAFRVDSAGQFSSLDLHNSFGLRIGYQELYKDKNDIKWEKWGLDFEAAFLDSDEVSGPFSGTIFLLTLPSGATFRRPTTAVRQFNEDLKEFFFKGNFKYRFDPRVKDHRQSTGEKHHTLAGVLNVDFSFWNIEREGKQTQRYPLLGLAETIRSFRDDRRILEIGTSYELDRPRRHFGGVYFLGLDFNWDVHTSDKAGGINLGFYY